MTAAANGLPFVSIDCTDRAALEQRLFGTTQGTGESGELECITDQSALFAAMGGTLYLMQLSEMPPRLQGRLARILRHGEVRVQRSAGESAVAQAALRPIGAVERLDGDVLVPDLHKRMAHSVIAVPPLRARREDVPGLVHCLVSDLCAAASIQSKTVSRQAVELLAALPWRGNVGELETLLRTLVSRVPARQIRLSDVLAHVRLDGHAALAYTGTLKEARERFEREYVAAVLDQHRGRMAEAARALGLQRTNLYRKVRQLAVRRRTSGRQLS
jgi:two-component system nitrogen regulation response regulator NtrX